MKKMSILIFAAVALAQLSVPVLMAWNRAQTLKHGRVWKFKTAPVDPVDALRGRYISLRFDIEEFAATERVNHNKDVYVVLKEDANGFAAVDHLSDAPVHGNDVVRAQAGGWSEGKQHIRFSFDRHWIAENIAREADAAYRDNSTRKNQNAFATVRVLDGDAALEQLYIGDQPLREYLRSVNLR